MTPIFSPISSLPTAQCDGILNTYKLGMAPASSLGNQPTRHFLPTKNGDFMDLFELNANTNYLLKNWSDYDNTETYIDYDALLVSDDEWLSLESLMQVEEF